MIKFSEKQLKIPKLMKPVYLVTAGQSKFDRAFPDKRTEELCVDALTQAAELINLSPAELKSYIHTCYYGHFADHFNLAASSVVLVETKAGNPGRWKALDRAWDLLENESALTEFFRKEVGSFLKGS